MLIDVSTGTVYQSHEKKCWTDTGDQCCQSLKNKNFKKVRESIAKVINGVYISKNAVFLWVNVKEGFLWLNAVFLWVNVKEGFLWLHNEQSWRTFKMNASCYKGVHIDTPHGLTPTGIQSQSRTQVFLSCHFLLCVM